MQLGFISLNSLVAAAAAAAYKHSNRAKNVYQFRSYFFIFFLDFCFLSLFSVLTVQCLNHIHLVMFYNGCI